MKQHQLTEEHWASIIFWGECFKCVNVERAKAEVASDTREEQQSRWGEPRVELEN